MFLTLPPMVASSLMFAVGEIAPPDANPVQYAVTQGGLLAVVLVLLYFQRQNEKEKAARNQERNESLMSLVEKSAAAHGANALAIQRLAAAVENLERK